MPGIMETNSLHNDRACGMQALAIDSQPMNDPLETYADWQLFLDLAGSSCSRQVADTLARGTFEEGAAGRVYRLICDYCVRCLDALDDELASRLMGLDPTDADGVFLACSRYCNACDHLLFFSTVKGIPSDWKRNLKQDIRRNMAAALRHVGNTCPATAGYDARYYLHCLIERRCA